MAYSQAFINERPKQGLDVIQSRLKEAKSLNLEVAEYFKERAIVEDNYVKGLQRLANKTFVADKSSLGTFLSVWDTLFKEVNEIVEIHSDYIKRVHEEVETRLREKVTSDPEWSQLKHYEINLSKLAREYEEKHSKVNKKRSKTEKHIGKKAGSLESKLMEVQKAFEQTQNEWNGSWLQFLERLQAADMSRLLRLKESLISFETIQAESYQRRVTTTEKTLNAIMDFDAQSEIEIFCARKSKTEVKKFTPNLSTGNESNELKIPSSSASNFQDGQASSSTSKIPVDGGSSNDENDSLSDVGVSASVIVDNETDNRAVSTIITTSESKSTAGQHSAHRQDNTSTDLSLSSPTYSTTSFEFPESVANYPRAASGSEVYPHGLRATISETINVMSKGGDVLKIFVTGEICVSYNFPNIKDHSAPIRIRIKNFEALEKFVLNTSYIRSVPESSGLYDIDTSLLSLSGGAPVAVMKYQLRIDSANKSLFMPLKIIPQWKCDPNLTLIMINYQANPECSLSGKLADLSFIIPVDGEVETAQSNPTGIWSTEKQRMYWKVDDVDLSAPEQKRILARFETKGVSKQAPATIKFVCTGKLLSNIFLEVEKVISNGNGIHENENHSEIDDIFKFQEVICQVTSGKFMASP